ncbi:MAG: NAD(P)/FAD-dependent oxidoreductase [Cytophagaceae bacterium]
MTQIIIIGGGISGLISSIRLSMEGIKVLLIEKKDYPFHRVCGEYISNEAVQYLKSIDAFPKELNPSHIDKLLISSASGKLIEQKLGLGGFGISRYAFDDFLYKRSLAAGTEFKLKTAVTDLTYANNAFRLKLSDNTEEEAEMVIGSYGKRANLDRRLNRDFFYKRSPFMGVKYHIKLPDYPKNLISLHNFQNGYCGIAPIEENKLCLCYLTGREHMEGKSSIREMEEEVLFSNPYLKEAFAQAEFLYEKPEVINEISFKTKAPVEGHLLMAGDSAGMISPLCGNGMAIAVHASKIVSELLILYFNKKLSREELEDLYVMKWQEAFSHRLLRGRILQNLLKQPFLTDLFMGLIKAIPFAPAQVIKMTHGKPF